MAYAYKKFTRTQINSAYSIRVLLIFKSLNY
jgi:hypothetical protein